LESSLPVFGDVRWALGSINNILSKDEEEEASNILGAGDLWVLVSEVVGAEQWEGVHSRLNILDGNETITAFSEQLHDVWGDGVLDNLNLVGNVSDSTGADTGERGVSSLELAAHLSIVRANLSVLNAKVRAG